MRSYTIASLTRQAVVHPVAYLPSYRKTVAQRKEPVALYVFEYDSFVSMDDSILRPDIFNISLARFAYLPSVASSTLYPIDRATKPAG